MNSNMKNYALVFGGLAALTLGTTGVAYIDLGPMNLPAAILIAALKASLVALFFMHTKKAEILIKVSVGGMLIWVGILLLLTFNDYISRHWILNVSFWQ